LTTTAHVPPSAPALPRYVEFTPPWPLHLLSIPHRCPSFVHPRFCFYWRDYVHPEPFCILYFFRYRANCAPTKIYALISLFPLRWKIWHPSGDASGNWNAFCGGVIAIAERAKLNGVFVSGDHARFVLGGSLPIVARLERTIGKKGCEYASRHCLPLGMRFNRSLLSRFEEIQSLVRENGDAKFGNSGKRRCFYP